MTTICVGIDTGGTFTDLVAVELERGRFHYHKVPTLTADPATGILSGIAELLDDNALARSDVKFVVLGTTLATNAVLQGKWAPTGMLTTVGFRDVLELARQRRPHYYNLDIPKPTPPAARDCRLEVEGRIGNDGAEVTPLSEDDVRRAIEVLKQKKVEAVAICFMHAYANPDHEERARALVKKLWPEVYLCTSSDVLAEFREFERFATATVNASLMPVMDRYLERFESGVADLGIRHAPRVMQSNGGAVSPGAVRKLPVNTFFSGPAGGVIGSVGLGNQLGLPNLITFDMGGTSTDVCLIRDGEPAKKSERAMGGFPVRTRTLDIHTIGAGGGSIAWTDAGGLLKVGPQSAGAHPGPAAYGRGGTKATVTDANVVLGRLNPVTLLGGRMTMHADKAQAAVDELAQSLGVDRTRAAAGVVEIINVNMMGAVRVISVEQGEDPRDFTLVAFGGAGPLHAADVARAMGMRKVLVPPRPGLLSAIGLLHADVRGDFSLTRLVRADGSNLKALNDGFRTLAKRGAQWLKGESEERGVFQWFADLRYFGQNFELIIELKSDRLDEGGLGRLAESFHRRHKDHYGYDMRAQPVEIVNLRLVVTGQRRSLPAERLKATKGDLKQALLEKRKVWFPETGYVATPVYDRERLASDVRITGPAIIEQMDTTTVVPPKARLKQDRFGYLHMELEPLTTKKERLMDRRINGKKVPPASATAKAKSSRKKVAKKDPHSRALVKQGTSRRATKGVPPRRSPDPRIGSIDPIQSEVVARFLLATAEEMGATLTRTAFSPNIKERADCSTAIFDRTGQVIALAQRVPIHLGSMVGAVDEILKRFPESEIKPGDMFLANDPYNGGGTHLPDINVIAPVFIGKRIEAYVANIAHHADVGGMVPGSEAAVCQSIYQEGLRVPPVRIMHAGKLNRDVFDIILLNSRTPDERVGDLQAQFAANIVGARSVTALFDRYGPRETAATIAAYLEFTEKRFRAAVEKLPPGRYEAEDFLDGNDEQSVAKIKLALTVGRGKLHFDFAGSGEQLLSARNIPYRALLATVYTVSKAMLDPEVPANAGYYRTLEVTAPPGTVVGPVPPAAIGCRSISASVLGDVIAAALSQALPHKALSGSGPHHLYVLSGTDPRTGVYFVNYETLAGGMGARANRDGVDGVRVHASGSSNLPVEALEHAYPFRVERYALWEGSGGDGRYRGGMGVVRDYRVLGDDIVVSLSSERQHVPAPGSHGGGTGALGAFLLNPGTAGECRLPAAAADVRLPRDSVLRICTPAGGGYGKPAQRDGAAIERDRTEQRLSGDHARNN